MPLFSRLTLLLFSLLLLSALPARADRILVSPDQVWLDLAPASQVWIDRTEVAPLSQVLAGVNWRPAADDGMNFGFVEAPVWLKLRLQAEGESPLSRFLVVDSPTVDELHFYIEDQTGLRQQSLGDAYPYGARLIDSRAFILPLEVPADQPITIYLQAREKGSLQLPVSLWQTDAWYQHYQYQQSALAAYFGLLLCLAFYNLCLLIYGRMRAHFFYVAYILCLGMVQASQTGFGSQFIWAQWPWLSNYVVSLFVHGSLIFAGLFSLTTLNLQAPSLARRWVLAVIGASVVLLPLTFVLSVPLHLKLTVLAGVIGCLVFLAVGLSQCRNGNETARIYTLAWTSLLLGAAIYGATKLGWFPLNAFTSYIFLIGSAIEGVLLSFSLAARLREMNRQQHEMAQLRLQNAVEREKLDSQLREAAAANAAKGRYLATISHEIRTPINGLMGAMELMDSAGLSNEQQEYLGIARHSGQVLLELVGNILDYSRFEAGVLDVKPAPFAVPALVEDLRTIFASQYRRKNLDFQCQLAVEVPDWVEGDRVRVRQVLINFISNAFKYTERGSVTLTVSVDGAWLRFQVSDTGVGISVPRQQRLFNEIQPSDPDDRAAGAGLGLWISKQLVTQMGGELLLRSAPGQGTCIGFTIPLLAVSPPVTAAEPPMLAPVPPQRPLQGRGVLIADDNAVNRLLLTRQLEKLGAQVWSSSNGAEALEGYRQQVGKVQVLLLDYEMPELNGCQVSTLVRQWEQQQGLPATTIIGLTAHFLPEIHQQMRAAGANICITKPASREQLLAAILGEAASHWATA